MLHDIKLWLIGLGVIGAGGGVYAFADPLPAGVYREPMSQAYHTLSTTEFPFRAHDVAAKASVSREGNGADKIFLTFSRDSFAQECTIHLAPYKNRGDATSMDVTCDSGGAQPGMGRAPSELFANSVAESADAALNGKPLRPLDEQLFEAAGPGEGASFNRVARDAVVMQRSIHDQFREMQKEQQEAQSDTSDESSGWADDSWTHDDTRPVQ